jgi:hypothetical protein
LVALEENVMRTLSCFVAAMLMAAGLAASQDLDKRTQTKIEVKDGRTVTVTGCVERSLEGGYVLTNVAGKEGAMRTYLLATDDDDIAKHVGHRIEVTGKAADQGNGKIQVETKNETKAGDDKTKTESKSELKGDLSGLPYLGVKSMRMLATVCP